MRKNNLFKIKPYTPGEQLEGMIKLNANENPYPPSPGVMKVIGAYDTDLLRKYPSSTGEKLVVALADYHGISKENIFVGNGSDEVLALAMRSFFNSGRPILFPELTYSFYPVWADFFGIDYKKIPLGKDCSIKVDDYYQDNGGIVIANPNAPTGKSLSKNKIEELLKNNVDSIVIVDEAYIDFGGESSVKLVEKYDNLVVTQTFSKGRSLAGMRIGAAFASKELIQVLRGVKDSFNSYPLDSIAIEAGVASLRDEEYFKEAIEKIKATRTRVKNELENLGIEVFESDCNFLLIKTKTAEEIKDYLKDKGVLIRYFDTLEDYLRISIGTDSEMDEFLKYFKEAIDVI